MSLNPNATTSPTRRGPPRTSLTLAIVAIVWLVAAAFRPYFPGDPAVTRGLQAIAGADTAWTAAVTATAKSPWKWILVALSALAAHRLGRWRGVAMALIAFAVLGWLEGFLKLWIARPRPSPEMVAVTEQAQGFSCPSSFGLTYISTIGFIGWAAAVHAGRPWSRVVPALAGILLAMGAAARIVPGAHWASDVVASYLLGAAAIHPLVHGMLPRTPAMPAPPAPGSAAAVEADPPPDPKGRPVS